MRYELCFVLVIISLPLLSHAEPPGTFRWATGAPFLKAASFENPEWIAIKDPSIVQFEGKWHLFCTLRGHERSHAIVYSSFTDFSEAKTITPIVLPNHDGYFCAPQVFWYSPDQKWYLVCQAKNSDWTPEYQAAYATTEDLVDPNSWSALKPMKISRPKDDERSPYLDFWIIRDVERVFNFFTSDNGKMWRCETTVDAFPLGWDEPVLAYEGDIFEASHIYRLADGRFANLIEAQAPADRRFFKILYANTLDADWQPRADDEETYASKDNIEFEGETWANSISHGELIRGGFDERMDTTLDSPFVFQGVLIKDRRGKDYGDIPWELGLLQPKSLD
ncbi:MAG: non-reducing end alpha-L-arabinofuranosidase family hydrolase [Verrucomicrobiota bacterium]